MATAAGEVRELDPFGLWPGMRSAVAGLGGSEPPRTPRYAFAAPLAAAGGRRAVFRLAFDGLEAPGGELRLRVAAQLPGSRRSRWVLDRRVPLAELARAGGRWEAAVRTRAGADYALTGQVMGAEGARARGLRLWMEGAGDGGRAQARLRRAAGRLRPAPGEAPASLAAAVAQACTAAQMEEPAFAGWMARLHTPARRHRKLWEFAWILQVLEQEGLLRPGARGLGFGCGGEPLPALMAAAGCEVLATDLAADAAEAAAWRGSGQHAADRERLRRPEVCPDAAFDARVRFRPADMRAIPADLSGFDFCWSACALEHLGSLRRGADFVEASLGPLRPGGVAVHTTELNLVSDRRTVDRTDTVIYRRRDLRRLARRLERAGHRVLPLNFARGEAPPDFHVDVAPYTQDPHLQVALAGFVATSFGLAVVKDGARRAAFAYGGPRSQTTLPPAYVRNVG